MENTLPTLTIAYYIASPTWGGGEQYVYNLAAALTQQQLARVLFFFPSNASKEMVQRFQQLGDCPTFNWNHKLFRFSLLAAWRLATLLEQYHVDILHLNSRQSYALAAWAKHFTRRPFTLIATQHLVRQAKNTPLWRFWYRHIDTLICASQHVQDTYLQPWPSHQSPFYHTVTVRNSVPFSPLNQPCRQDTDCPIILFVGRVCQEKGLLPLLRRLEQLTQLPFQLWIIGKIDSAFQVTWENALQQSPIRERVRMLGFCKNVREWIPQCHIGVIPTLPPEAGGPLALIEDMAMGLPTISSNNGSQTEYIQSMHNGLLCPPEDDAAWVQSLHMLLTNPPLRLQLGTQAQKDFNEKYNYSIYLKQMVQLYQIC